MNGGASSLSWWGLGEAQAPSQKKIISPQNGVLRCTVICDYIPYVSACCAVIIMA